MSSSFPVTSVTLIAKIKTLSPGEDSAEWVRFWDTYSLAIRQFAAMKGGEANADDIVMTVVIAICENSRTKPVFTELTGENAPVVLVPKWMEKTEAYAGKIIAMPARDDIDFPVEEHLIVELYSK